MTKHNPQMQISEAELFAATRDLDELHHQYLPVMHEAGEDTAANIRAADILSDGVLSDRVWTKNVSRRQVLGGAAAAMGALVLAACGSKKSTGTTVTSPTTTASAGGDLKVAMLSASLENLAVQTYTKALQAATAGSLGVVPPAVATFATTAKKQHQDHADAWNAVVTKAGQPKVTGVDKTVLDAVVTPGFAAVKDVVSLANFALVLENSAAATYQYAIGVLTDSSAVLTAATIQPVEMQHAAILSFILGDYPVPDDFSKVESARPLTDQIA